MLAYVQAANLGSGTYHGFTVLNNLDVVFLSRPGADLCFVQADPLSKQAPAWADEHLGHLDDLENVERKFRR